MPFLNNAYQIINPNPNNEFHADWNDCRKQLRNLASQKDKRIFKIDIFVHDTEAESFLQKKSFIKKELAEIFGSSCPTYGIIPQSPEKPYHVTIETGIILSDEVIIHQCKHGEFIYTVLEKEGHKELWANGIEDGQTDLSTEISSKFAFEKLKEILESENMSLNNIVRQWNYIGNIISDDVADQSIIQHYQIFNKLRRDYYSRFRTIPGFPAATGIGMNFNGVTIEICAISMDEAIMTHSINNPKQVKPYAYNQQVLTGDPLTGETQKSAPQFERAKLVECSSRSRLFISGTASIIGQETLGINDVEAQTKITIDNIGTLIERANLQHRNQKANAFNIKDCSCIRVYVKHFGDIPLVKSICTNHFGDSPANYVQTDICRDSLLVEIEAELNLIN